MHHWRSVWLCFIECVWFCNFLFVCLSIYVHCLFYVWNMYDFESIFEYWVCLILCIKNFVWIKQFVNLCYKMSLCLFEQWKCLILCIFIMFRLDSVCIFEIWIFMSLSISVCSNLSLLVWRSRLHMFKFSYSIIF